MTKDEKRAAVLRGLQMELEHLPGDFVYLKTDPDNLCRIVTAFRYAMHGGITYVVALGTQETEHFGDELSNSQYFKN